MNKTSMTIVAVGALAAVSNLHGQMSFGTWDSPVPPTKTATDTVGLFNNPAKLLVTLDFNVTGTLTPNVGSPTGSQSYGIKYNSVVLRFTSLNGNITGGIPSGGNSYIDKEVGPVTIPVTVNVVTPGQPISIPANSKTEIAYVDLNPSLAGNNATFTVTWLSASSAPVEAGGKGVSFSATLHMNGFVDPAPVPEPGEYALLVGLGLLGFVGYRRARRQ